MRCKRILFATVLVFLAQGIAQARVDLVVLPKREAAQLTIYNSADLTLVRDSRALTLKNGLNTMQFSWANTLIDPTSLEMQAKMNADSIDVLDLTFPPRVRDLALWHVQSQTSGNVPVEITYLTSGLSWRAFYMGTLSTDEKTMGLEGYVRVTNQSGEDYENAQVRLIVGKINLIDQIADLARRQYPYGRPGAGIRPPAPMLEGKESKMMAAKRQMALAEKAMKARPKEITKEGLSEYFLYTIEGTETIPHGWSKRLPSFKTDAIPVVNLYKYEEERYGDHVVRFLSFKNDKDHNLGDTPIPGGVLKVYRDVGESAHLSYEGQSNFKYIPVNEDVELSLGSVANVLVKPTLMNFATGRFLFNGDGNITGWDEIRDFEIEVKNTRGMPVTVDIRRNFETSSWELDKTGDFGDYEKVDLDTVKFVLRLNAHDTKKFHYIITSHHGTRAD